VLRHLQVTFGTSSTAGNWPQLDSSEAHYQGTRGSQQLLGTPDHTHAPKRAETCTAPGTAAARPLPRAACCAPARAATHPVLLVVEQLHDAGLCVAHGPAHLAERLRVRALALPARGYRVCTAQAGCRCFAQGLTLLPGCLQVHSKEQSLAARACSGTQMPTAMDRRRRTVCEARRPAAAMRRPRQPKLCMCLEARAAGRPAKRARGARLQEAAVLAQRLVELVAGDARERVVGVDERHVGAAAVRDGDALPWRTRSALGQALQ